MDDLVIDLRRLSYVTVEARRAMMVSRSICVVTVEVRRSEQANATISQDEGMECRKVGQKSVIVPK